MTIKKSMTKRQVFIWFLRVLKVLLIIALLVDIAAYVLIIVGGVLGDSLDLDERIFIVLAALGYLLVCVSLVIAEIGPEWFLNNMRIFHFWGFRGGALAWQGIQTIYSATQLASSLASAANTRLDVTKALGTICGYSLIGIGLLYILLSALCLRDLLKLDLPYDHRDGPNLENREASLMIPMIDPSDGHRDRG